MTKCECCEGLRLRVANLELEALELKLIEVDKLHTWAKKQTNESYQKYTKSAMDKLIDKRDKLCDEIAELERENG